MSEAGSRIPTPESPKGANIFELGKDFLLLLGFLLVGMTVAGSVSAILPTSGSTTLFAQAAFTSTLAFLLPALLVDRLCRKDGKSIFYLNVRPEWLKMMLACALALLGMAALNQIIYWNENISFPQAWKGIEETWRAAEEMNADYYRRLTSGTDTGSLIVGILVIGLLTGISEEFFFRGAMIGIFLKGGISRIWSVWIAAAIFSLLHFQMFGFVPRLLLGAWFGYLYVWSGRIWLSSVAHAFNNSLVVLTLWLSNNGWLSEKADSFGVSETGFPLIPLISAAIFSVALIPARKYFMRDGKEIW